MKNVNQLKLGVFMPAGILRRKMITDRYDLESKKEQLAKQLIEQIASLAEALCFEMQEKFNIKFKLERINPYL